MKDLERKFKALADNKRLRILKILGKQKMCVCELASVLGIAQPSVSRHLKKLKKAGLIESEQNGFWTDYYIARNGNCNYLNVLIQNLRNWCNDDCLVLEDLKKIKKIKKIDRQKLCSKK
ncbi:MAG: metalloregulator ArsR/SmtB family transcription factor [Candidatus Omnitrophica bacterium]|nr:metalloregulator ArsR/SmtB family transcription factor [Candidatus Omnitrophota bacterium]